MAKQCDCDQVLNILNDLIQQVEVSYHDFADDYKEALADNEKNPTRAPEVKMQNEYSAAIKLQTAYGGLNALKLAREQLKEHFDKL